MSTQIAGPNVFRRLREPAALNYLVMTGAGMLVYGMMMLAIGNDAAAIIAMLLALAGILARWTAAPVLIILLTTYSLMDPGFGNLMGWFAGVRWAFPRPSEKFSVEDLIQAMGLAGGLLAYTIGHFRLTAIIHQGMPDDPSARKERDPLNPPRRPASLIPQDELPRILIIGGICVVLGLIAWWSLVLIEWLGRNRESEFTIGTARFILVAWLTGLALMVASAALVYLRSAKMTRTEAALVLRDEFFHENRRETDRLQRWRKWFKERVARRRAAKRG
jgi:hypothetical protein